MIKRNKSEDLGEASIKFCINRKELLNTSPIEVVSCASNRRSREEREQNRSKNYGKSQTSSFVSKDSVSNFNFKNNRVDAYVRKNIPPFQANDFYSNAKGKVKCSKTEMNTPMVSKTDELNSLNGYAIDREKYACNDKYHDELEKLPQYIIKSFQNIQKIESMISDSDPSIKSNTIDNIIENFGFIDPVIRVKRGKSKEVFKTINNIQFCGPQILKATESLISKVQLHKENEEENMKLLNRKFAKEKEVLGKTVNYLKKDNHKHIVESSLKIQSLKEELKKSQSEYVNLSQKLEEAKRATTKQTKLDDNVISIIDEHNQMK